MHINWYNLLIILLSMIGVVGAFTRWIIGRLDTIRDKIENIEDRVIILETRSRRWWKR